MEPIDEEQNTDRWVEERLKILSPSEEWQPDARRGFALFREKRQRGVSGRGKWPQRTGTWMAISAMATCVSLMATPVTRAFAERCVSACVSQSSWLAHFVGVSTGGPPSVAYLRPKDRKLAPDLMLNDAAGNRVTLSAYRGQVVLLNFWATWCAPCKTEIPWFVEFQKNLGGRGLSVIGVSLDDGGWASVRPFIKRKGVNYPVVIGNDEITSRFEGVQSLPTTLIIDKAGRIAAVHVGTCKKSEYENDIQAVLDEQ